MKSAIDSRKILMNIEKPLTPYVRIEGNTIILDGAGKFPIPVKINLGYCWKDYRLVKTIKDGLILTK